MPKNPLTDFLQNVVDTFRDAADLVEESVEQAQRIQQAAQTAQQRPVGRPRTSAGRVGGQTTTQRQKRAPGSRKSQESSFYDVLEVSPKASQETIAAAFRSLSSRFHPDKKPGKSGEEKMRQVSEAYAMLKDPEKRKRYDRVNGV